MQTVTEKLVKTHRYRRGRKRGGGGGGAGGGESKETYEGEDNKEVMLVHWASTGSGSGRSRTISI